MPIQRHASLVPLSRDHHSALRLARDLRRGDARPPRPGLPVDSRAWATYLRETFARDLEPHFLAEEEVLVVRLAGKDGELDRLCRQMLAEHAQMRAVVNEVGRPSLSTLDLEVRLSLFGELLEAHVRMEERELYERAQEVLEDDALGALGDALARHREAHAGGPSTAQK